MPFPTTISDESDAPFIVFIITKEGVSAEKQTLSRTVSALDSAREILNRLM